MNFSSTTYGVKVSARVMYQPKHSRPLTGEYVFAYEITIENNSNNTIKLLKRHWNIIDSFGMHRSVEGEGVVGRQPTLEPGDKHTYISGCHLNAAFGRMGGTYTMLKLVDETEFEVEIPTFLLEAPMRLN